MKSNPKVHVGAFVKMNLKTKKVERGILVLAIAVVFVASILFMSNVLSNLDEANANGKSNEVFMNADKRRVVVRRIDGKDLNESDYERIKNINHITSVDPYDTATDINYYCEYGEDYRSSVKGGNEEFEVIAKGVTLLSSDKYVRSAACITEDDLAEGRLPEKSNEVVLYSDDKGALGSSKVYFFNDSKTWPKDDFITLKMTIVGILKEKTKQTYFAEVLCDALELNTFRDNNWAVLFERPSMKLWLGSNNTFAQNCFIYPDAGLVRGRMFCLSPDVDQRMKFMDRFYIMPMNKDRFFIPDDDEENTLGVVVIKIAGVPMRDDGQGTVYRVYNASRAPFYSVTVSDETMKKLASLYPKKQMSVYLDEYAYFEDAEKEMYDAGYLSISVFGVSAFLKNKEYTTERIITVAVSLGTIIAIYFILYFIIRIIFLFRRKQCFTFLSIGMAYKILFKMQQTEGIICYGIGIVIGAISYFIINYLKPEFFGDALYYIRFYHIIVLLILELMVVMLGIKGFQTKLMRLTRKGVFTTTK